MDGTRKYAWTSGRSQGRPDFLRRWIGPLALLGRDRRRVAEQRQETQPGFQQAVFAVFALFQPLQLALDVDQHGGQLHRAQAGFPVDVFDSFLPPHRFGTPFMMGLT